MAEKKNPVPVATGDGVGNVDSVSSESHPDSRPEAEKKKALFSDLKAAALDYAARGLAVFPCRADTKAPLVKGGFKSATTDAVQISEWWKQWPAAMIGMPTGPASGIDVLDIDVKHDGYAAVPDWAGRSSVIVKTPTGGAHLWFASDGSIRNTASEIGPGVDTRGQGGYVIVPPSRRNGAAYVFEKGSVDDRANLPPFPPDLAARMKMREVNRTPGADPEAPLDEVAALVAVIPNIDLGWDSWNRIGMAIWRATGGAGFEVFDQFSKKSEIYDAAETRNKWGQLFRSPPNQIGVGTLRHMAEPGIEKALAHANRNAPSFAVFLAAINGRPVEMAAKVENPKPAPEAKVETPGVNMMIPDPGPRVQMPTEPTEKKRTAAATPFLWVDPTTLPRRQWLYRPHYIRRFLSLTVAAGGIGKSSLVLVEALALATGRPLLGIAPVEPVSVWYVNLEDPLEELQRRIAAICVHYEIEPEEFSGRLFVDSGRDADFVITRQARRNVAVDETALINNFIAEVQMNKIDVLIVDPFVAVHRAEENDNTAMEEVAQAFARIADECNCSVMLVHHARKTGGEKATVEHGRGASALNAAARTVRVLNTMTDREAENAEIDEWERRRYFRSDVGKANLTKPAEVADWYELRSVDLGNSDGVDWDQGDRVGVVVAFDYPEIDRLKPTAAQIHRAQEAIRAGGPWRADQRAKKEPWVGVPIAEVLGVDIEKKPDKRAMVLLVKEWLKAKLLIRVERRDDHREKREYIEAGEPAVVEEPRREEDSQNG